MRFSVQLFTTDNVIWQEQRHFHENQIMHTAAHEHTYHVTKMLWHNHNHEH